MFSFLLLTGIVILLLLKMRADDTERYEKTCADIVAASKSDDPILKKRWAPAFGGENHWKNE